MSDKIWPVQPVPNAKDTTLDKQPGTLPNLMDGVANWFQLVIFEKIVKTTVNFKVVETTTPVKFQGVVMTDPRRKLVMMPNGQRLWKTKSVYTWPNVPLEEDDVVVYQGTQYRVLQGADFTQYGIQEYWLVEDYSGAGPTEVS